MINSQNILRPNQGGTYIEDNREGKSNAIGRGTALATEIGHRISDRITKKSFAMVYFDYSKG